MNVKIANVRLVTVKAFRRATYRPIEKTRSMKAAEVDISQYCLAVLVGAGDRARRMQHQLRECRP
jgi:hypothetical protein